MPTYTPTTIARARQGRTVVVARYDPDRSAPECYTPLPNIRCVQVQYREGPDPGTARFRYVFDPQVLGTSYPWRLEHVFSFKARGPYVIRQDDRIVVLVFDSDGNYSVIFDGFSQVPQGDLAKAAETATFEALGVAVREWDNPIEGAIYREGPNPSVVSDVATGLPARFNPDGVGNASPTNGNVAAVGRTYATFCDHRLDPDTRRKWDLAMAVRYIFGVGGSTSTYIAGFNDFAVASALFDTRTPKGATVDFSDPATYDSSPIIVQDIDVTGKPWPVALHELLSPHNFGFYFHVSTSSTGKPKTVVDFFRRDGGDGRKPKNIYLPIAGGALFPGQVNLGEFHVSRDASQVRNRIVLDTNPAEYEASFMLVPGFVVDAADVATPAKFTIGDPLYTGANVDKYRVYIFAEAGDSWWDFPSSTTKTTATSLDDLLGEPYDDVPGEPPVPRYAKRRRIPQGRLITKNLGAALNAQLWISKDYNGAIPGLWNRTGTWQLVPASQWSALKDRIGIRIDRTNLVDLNFESPSTPGATTPTATGKINLIKSQASPTTGADISAPRVFFRYTCVIEGDDDLDAVAIRRASSSTKHEITQRIETRDRFRKRIIAESSHLNTVAPVEDVTDIDETDEALAYAQAMRNAHETAVMAGSFVVPRFTQAYQVGDRIRRVKGRNIDMSTTSATEQGEAARYPMVVGIAWDFDGRQTTSAQLSDMRAEPARDRTG